MHNIQIVLTPSDRAHLEGSEYVKRCAKLIVERGELKGGNTPK